MKRKEKKNEVSRAWEQGCYERAANFWVELVGAYRARDLGAKIAAMESLCYQLKAWKELLEMGVEK